ncbi:MAG: 50S ribosomal protein L20 [Elusimicrobiota bacterium]
MRVKKGKTKSRRHKKYLKQAKGYSHAKSHRFRNAKDQVEKSLQYSTRDRKAKKRLMRKLWITRINAACSQHGVKYSRFISGLKKNEIKLDRRMLSAMAIEDAEAFKKLIDISAKKD